MAFSQSCSDDSLDDRRQLTAVSHEVRTALQAIQVIADELGRSGLSVPQGELLATLRMAAGDALATVNGQLPPTAGGLAPGSITADRHAASLIEQQVAIARPAAEAKGLRLIATLPASGLEQPEQPVLASACAEALTLIARNLISNAVAYTTAGHIDVSCHIDSELTLVVADTGVGFPPSDAERIFEEGVRLRPPLVGSSPAGGFGLALSRRAAQACGGSITAQSDGLRGATFRVTLPLGPKGLVLLADDAKSIRELLTLQLTSEGYGVLTVADGGAALAAAKVRRFTAIVLDGEMPVMSGSQTAYGIRAYFRGLAAPCPPLIALSGGSNAAPDGVWSAVWRKPVGREEMVAGLAELSGGSTTP